MTVERQLSIATEGFRGGGTPGAAFLVGTATLTGADVATEAAGDVASLSKADKATTGQASTARTPAANTATLGGRLIAKKVCD